MIFKVLPLIVGLFLTYFLPKVFHKRTHQLAVEELFILEQDNVAHDTLDYLLDWRDMINAVVLSLFVLLFSVDEDVTSTNSIIASIAEWIVFGLIPVMIVVVMFLVNTLKPASVKGKRGYWWACVVIIVLCYMLSVVSIFLPK